MREPVFRGLPWPNIIVAVVRRPCECASSITRQPFGRPNICAERPAALPNQPEFPRRLPGSNPVPHVLAWRSPRRTPIPSRAAKNTISGRRESMHVNGVLRLHETQHLFIERERQLRMVPALQSGSASRRAPVFPRFSRTSSSRLKT